MRSTVPNGARKSRPTYQMLAVYHSSRYSVAMEIVDLRKTRLTVLGVVPNHGAGRNVMFRCQCDCGNERVLKASEVRRRVVTACKPCSLERGRLAGLATRAKLMPEREATARELQRRYRINAGKRGLIFALDLPTFRTMCFEPCHYCGAEPSPWNGIDRIDGKEGYIDGNIVTACAMCNYAKRGHSVDAFLAWATQIHAHQLSLKRGKTE